MHILPANMTNSMIQVGTDAEWLSNGSPESESESLSGREHKTQIDS